MKNVKYNIIFLLQRKKILYDIMNYVEDDTWYRVNRDLYLSIRQTNSLVCEEVMNKVKKQIEFSSDIRKEIENNLKYRK